MQRIWLAVTMLIFLCLRAYAQQDVDFHLNGYYLKGNVILKAKRDFHDPYLWVLAKNNEVYRINSLSKEIEDLSKQFSAFSNLEFIDIAGHNRDTVYIACKSNQIIQYNSGSTKLIGSTEGLLDTVTSIGKDRRLYDFEEFQPNLLIGTLNGIYNYRIRTEQLIPPSKRVLSKIFNASYRNAVYSGIDFPEEFRDTIKYVPVEISVAGTTGGEYLWLGGKEFGNHTNTAYFATWSSLPYNDVLLSFASLYWGNDRGMFHLMSGYSYSSMWPHRHYLPNITVNKITSIYGITSFGEQNGVIRENLLVGTEKGLYFGNNMIYAQIPSENSLNHYEPLGNVAINDIDVNSRGDEYNICEDGVWLATNEGLYLLKPDYTKYISGRRVEVVHFKDLPTSISEKLLCSNEPLSAEVTSNVSSANTIQWFKDGKELKAQGNTELLITEAGEYYAIIYDPCSTVYVETNHLKVRRAAAPVFTFNYPDQIKLCPGSTSTLKVQGSSTYQYRWYKNDALTGEISRGISIDSPGTYKVEVSSCPDSWVSSKEVTIDFTQLPKPIITSDKNNYCTNEAATLSVNIPADSSYNFDWLINGMVMPEGKNRHEITVGIPGNYTVSVSNSSNCIQTSDIKLVTFAPLPKLSIEQVIRTTLCSGQAVDIKANYTGGSVRWSTGETGDQISVTKPGLYKAIVTSAAGCITEAQTEVHFLPNPVFNVPDTSLCEFIQETIILKAPPGFEKYIWNGVPGGSNYAVNKSGKVTLVIEDENGCRASREIVVGTRCNEILTANTFTPNGDGINDSWRITGLDNDPSVLIQVYNRYGNLVYSEKGYQQPWDGKSRGQKLPAGTYYYVITVKNGRQQLSGSITIIY